MPQESPQPAGAPSPSAIPTTTAIRQRLGACRAVLIGCGALGTVLAEQLIRAGLANLRIIDRDIVEPANLQRQTLYAEQDATAHLPKAVAAARRLAQISSIARLDPIVADLDTANAESLIVAAKPDILLDATDNAETRYLLNDVAVKHIIPWVYGGCVLATGRVMPILPGRTPCLRCVFPEPPAPGELPTCDTAGLLAPAAAVVASMQTIAAIQLLTGDPRTFRANLISFDLWQNTHHHIDITTPDPDCPACAHHRYDFLDRAPSGAARLCGQNAVHVRPPRTTHLDLPQLARKLATHGPASSNDHVIHWLPDSAHGLSLTIFADGRMTVHGTADLARAKSLYCQYIGT